MKTTSILLTSIGLLFFCGQIASAQPATSDQEEIQEKIEMIDRDLTALKLKINRLVYEKYFEQAEQGRISPDVFKLKTFNAKQLFDTIPHLGELENAYKVAYKDWETILKTDKKYMSIHQEYMRLRGSTDQTALNLNRQAYNEMYIRLRANNPDYAPAHRRKSEAMFARNLALTRFLLNYTHEKNEELPTHIIPEQQLADIQSDVELQNLRQEFNNLLMIRRRLNIRLMNLKYETPKDNSQRWEKTMSIIEM